MYALAAETNVETEHLQELLVHHKTSHNGVQLLNFYDVIPVTDNLSRSLSITQASLERFGRLKVNNEVYHAEIYERPTKFNNSAISYIMQEEHYRAAGQLDHWSSTVPCSTSNTPYMASRPSRREGGLPRSKPLRDVNSYSRKHRHTFIQCHPWDSLSSEQKVSCKVSDTCKFIPSAPPQTYPPTFAGQEAFQKFKTLIVALLNIHSSTCTHAQGGELLLFILSHGWDTCGFTAVSS